MDDEETVRTDVEFAVADACWRLELVRSLGRPVTEDMLVSPNMMGDAGSAVRAAFEERRRTLHAWRQARGIA